MPMQERETAAFRRRSRNTTTTAASWASGSEQLNTVCERSTNKEGDPEGEAGSPCGLLESLLRAGVLRSQHRLPSQLGNGMPLDLTDALCGDSPDRADIGKLCLTAVNESIPAAYDVGRTLV